MKRLLIVLFLFVISSSAWGGEKIYLLSLSEAITPLTAAKIENALKQAREEGAKALVIELDTPGGLVTTTRQIIKTILSSEIPVVVFVYPPGAQAASAGTFITLASHVAAMAPGTNLGAAHPVTMGQKMDKEMSKKAENDLAALARSLAKLRGRNADWAEKAVRESVSATAEEALKLKVIDFLAQDLDDLLQKLDGYQIELKDRKITFSTKHVQVVEIEEDLRSRILRLITNPNIAYILLMIGLAGLYFELSHPGAILPGVVGALCLILAFYAMHLLPVNYAGLLLILLSGLLFFLEIKITSYGLLALAGLVSLILGSLMLFGKNPEALRVSYQVLFPVLLTVGLFFCVVTYLAAKAVLRQPATGPEGLVGERGEALSEINAQGGQVFVHGEIWQATSKVPIAKGEKVRVVAVEGLKLKVVPDEEEEL